MTSIQFNAVEQLIIVIGIIAMILSWWLRVRIFTRFDHDPVIREVIRDTFVTTAYDLISIELFRGRHRLSRQAKPTVFAFIVLNWSFPALFGVAVVFYMFRRMT